MEDKNYLNGRKIIEDHIEEFVSSNAFKKMIKDKRWDILGRTFEMIRDSFIAKMKEKEE